MAATMRAAISRGPHVLEVTDLRLAAPDPGEARIRIEACGICGSDLHLYHGGLMVPGVVPGHEMVGVVDALGEGVDGLRPGDRVAVEPLHSCGRCEYCETGRDVLCPEAQLYGVHRNGGFAEYLALPARRLFPTPADVAPAVAALAEPMAVVVHALRRGNFAAGQRVLVLGAGTIGLLAAKAAAVLGAGEVWITARHRHQAELALSLGAVRVLPEAEAAPEALAALGRESPFDLVVETVGGSAPTLRDACHAVRPGGVICVLGLCLGDSSIPSLPLLLKENTIVWSNCYAHPREDTDFEKAVELVAAHRAMLEALTTHAVPLAEIERGFALASDKQTGAIKVTVIP